MAERAVTDAAATARLVRVLRMIAVAIAAAAAIFCVVAVFHTLRKAPYPEDPFTEAHRAADLRYELVWLGVSATLIALALFTRSLAWAFAPLCLLGLEAGGHVAHWLVAGGRYHPLPSEVRERFEPHPLLVAVPRPGVHGLFTHTAQHRRLSIGHSGASAAIGPSVNLSRATCSFPCRTRRSSSVRRSSRTRCLSVRFSSLAAEP